MRNTSSRLSAEPSSVWGVVAMVHTAHGTQLPLASMHVSLNASMQDSLSGNHISAASDCTKERVPKALPKQVEIVHRVDVHMFTNETNHRLGCPGCEARCG